MNRLLLLPLALLLAAISVSAAEQPLPAVVSIAELEAQPVVAPSDPNFWESALHTTEQALRLIESNSLKSADELFRVSKFVMVSDNRFRNERVRYELLLSAAALGHQEAEEKLAAAWDRMLHALGRPLRTDLEGLTQKRPEYYQSDLTVIRVLEVLRDPPTARLAARSAERNPEIKSIVEADQADRLDWTKLTQGARKAVGERDRVRNQRIREIIKSGELYTAIDFANAALVMQHSAHFTGYQIAHELAVCSMLLGDRSSGRWLVAATYDRMLGSVGHDQRFGTQFSGSGPAASLVQVDTRGICDVERKALGCPTLEEAKNRNLRAAPPKEDAKLVAEFSGPNRSVRDPEFGLSTSYPEGWKIRDVKRWGDQQNTIFFQVVGAQEPSPNLYYRIYREPRPLNSGALLEYVRQEAKKKRSLGGNTGRITEIARTVSGRSQSASTRRSVGLLITAGRTRISGWSTLSEFKLSLLTQLFSFRPRRVKSRKCGQPSIAL